VITSFVKRAGDLRRIARLPYGLLQRTEVQTEHGHLTRSQDIRGSGGF
jgi:hypothetical protein